ncbi:hypothetical protein LSO58_18380 (plasmid) [Acinetobacter ursingii]|uniref:Lipoprotein n=1 Tax=Acinetobacter ursingii TaxID=108980 RepID=A0AA46PCL0_9GAMM|nr:hypothetical protein [Acinetobacter ursingii]UYF77403.1 hypothetical protein LSO58_18380 [Acinetobacter ursingii]
MTKLNHSISFMLLGSLIFSGCSSPDRYSSAETMEITDKAYFHLYNEYNYVKDSDAGKSMKVKIESALKDHVISGEEYKKITGENPSADYGLVPKADLQVYQVAKEKFFVEFAENSKATATERTAQK